MLEALLLVDELVDATVEDAATVVAALLEELTATAEDEVLAIGVLDATEEEVA